jgi:AbrB family looped-hinge helix DNA binding protein
MALAQSRLTSQGQISVPAEVRRRLGIGPGSVIEWDEEGGNLVVRRAAKHTMTDVHRALFPVPPARRTDAQIREGIRAHIRKKHARR